MTRDLGTPLPMLPASLGFSGDTSPCMANACTACCHDTQMPLLPADVSRLVAATGRPVAGFSVTDAETGERRLKNEDGRCVFLGAEGCTVYQDRPAGCRLYPLVYDAERHQGTLDEDCPYRTGFRTGPHDEAALEALVAALYEE